MNLHEALHFARMVERYGFGYPMQRDELKEFCGMSKSLIEAAMARPKGEDANKSEPTWQERMQKEYRELKERYEKLHRMVTKYEAGTLDFTPNCPIELLKQQKRHMGEYLHDLEIRAEIEKVEL